MQPSALTVFDKSEPRVQDAAQAVGYACMVMAAAPVHAERQMHCVRSVIEPAVAHKTIRFYFNEGGRPVGYVAWALLGAEAERRVLKTARTDLHMSEWTEGDSLWIIDMLAPFGHLKHIMRDLRDVLFAEHAQVRYCRRKQGKAIAKQIGRDSRCSFMRDAALTKKI
jgi:cytolysin-activating lysine-acyltransferase